MHQEPLEGIVPELSITIGSKRDPLLKSKGATREKPLWKGASTECWGAPRHSPNPPDLQAVRGEAFSDHRAEIARFANGVSGAAVSFHSLSYRDWLRTWPLDGPVAQHGAELMKCFEP